MASGNSTAPTDGAGNANIVYILYLAGVVVGITPLIGVIMAYIWQADAPDWLKTHYRFQIRTFWISLLFGVICMILVFVIIGWFLLLAAAVWYIVRCVKGMTALSKQQPIADPASWLFG